MAEVKRLSLVKPTLTTRYHIDFNWWQNNDRDWRVYLQTFLCEEHQKAFAEINIDEMVDSVDPDTAEVQQVDGLQHVLMTHCTRQPEFAIQQMPLVDSVFRIFLTNGNTPLTPYELADSLSKDANLILRTLSGMRVYKGLRPILN